MVIHIVRAQFPEDAEPIRSLFSGYASSLGIDLTFQSFQEELDSLPGKYAASQGGALLIARQTVDPSSTQRDSTLSAPPLPRASQVLGCVALRRSAEGWGEMKRLYVLQEARGQRLGDKLIDAILAQAKVLGYKGVRLDTLPQMSAAQALYRKHGFVDIVPYYETPIQGTVFMGHDF
ncbi:unnamed protein product [Penicillium olsonii]|uniref:N-acetyltransferase domain-containing protein n=1 Tax=Penicillium olsonii TaxID=99116 RepID=A0A9W4HN41_PENOL|nr:unnamed protein product [Penicillium olsonii]CAG8172407.1 unnamed protein product [Penicillium olsonii]CAG8184760.1 unnamed protein product [Penicillium olsonii]